MKELKEVFIKMRLKFYNDIKIFYESYDDNTISYADYKYNFKTIPRPEEINWHEMYESIHGLDLPVFFNFESGTEEEYRNIMEKDFELEKELYKFKKYTDDTPIRNDTQNSFFDERGGYGNTYIQAIGTLEISEENIVEVLKLFKKHGIDNSFYLDGIEYGPENIDELIEIFSN